jgi:membrane associated rhomboid family serine protease
MATEVQTCYRHPDRRAGVSCQRCDRPICPSCMSSASVGFHCPECSRQGHQRVYTARTLSTLNRPIVTQVLIAINVVAYFATSSNQYSSDFLLYGPLVASGEWYRLVTGGFLHANLLHLGMNMFALWILGNQLETVLGKVRFGIVYFAALMAASLGVMLVSPLDATVGASGAIYGLFGVAVAYQLARGISLMQSGLGGILLINLLFTFGIPGISIGGHVGGLAGGFVCGLIIYQLGPRLNNELLVNALCVALGVACAVGGLAAAQALA